MNTKCQTSKQINKHHIQSILELKIKYKKARNPSMSECGHLLLRATLLERSNADIHIAPHLTEAAFFRRTNAWMSRKDASKAHDHASQLSTLSLALLSMRHACSSCLQCRTRCPRCIRAWSDLCRGCGMSHWNLVHGPMGCG